MALMCITASFSMILCLIPMHPNIHYTYEIATVHITHGGVLDANSLPN